MDQNNETIEASAELSDQEPDLASQLNEMVEHQPYMYAVARENLTNRSNIGDVVQRGWEKVWRALNEGGYEDQGIVKSYLGTVVTRLAYDQNRKDRNRAEKAIDDFGCTEAYSIRSVQQQPYPAPEQVVLENEGNERFEQTLGLLENSNHREVLKLFYKEEYTYAEIADILGIAEGTVGSRLNRAIESLREKLTEREDLDIP